jgi:hypothetical protein
MWMIRHLVADDVGLMRLDGLFDKRRVSTISRWGIGPSLLIRVNVGTKVELNDI